MTDKNLRTLLEELHNELQHAERVDERGLSLLHELDADIRGLLQRSGDEGLQTDDSILERFQSAMEHFEITHPKLTMAISEMLTALSNAGI